MSWNYRLVHRWLREEYGAPHIYAVHECYYNRTGSPITISLNPIAPIGESLNELKVEMGHYMKALKEPILEFDSFDGPKVKKRGAKEDET